nr:tightly associated factor II-60 - fruit fly (Drosophila melanogaster) (fragments) [Drosophila melanogaster]
KVIAESIGVGSLRNVEPQYGFVARELHFTEDKEIKALQNDKKCCPPILRRSAPDTAEDYKNDFRNAPASSIVTLSSNTINTAP